jgi:hypothetical protein
LPVVRYARKAKPVAIFVSKRLTTAPSLRVVPVIVESLL